MKTLIILSFICFEVSAKIPEAVKTEIDLRIEHQLNPSIVIGIFENGKADFYVKGFQNKALNQAATTKTVYEIGSITKTFTCLLLAQLINDDKLKLNDPVQKFWPETFKLVDNDNQAITMMQLATHTSGMPRLPANLNPFSNDPYANYDLSQLVFAVNQLNINKSGTNYAYSNFAFGLLGETLSLIENTTYNDLISIKILQPLYLKQTYMLLDQVPKSLLAQGYSGKKAVDPWQFKALAGAGSIRSSIEDLLAYGIAHLNHSKNNLSTAMQLATNSHYQQGKLNVGLGWHINPDGVIWHNGGTAGFRSIILIDPVQQKVVAAITNTSNNIEDIATHLMNPSKPMVNHEFPTDIATEQLDQFTGTFNHPATNKNITIIKQKDQLFFTAHLQPRQVMTYINNDNFKLTTFKVKLEFLRGHNDEISALNLKGWGDAQRYQKIANAD